MIFGVRYTEETTKVEKWKYFSKMLVETDNRTGAKTIAYWPVDGTGMDVYDSSNNKNWNQDTSPFGYDCRLNQTIKVVESTLLDVDKINKIYIWFTENATKMPY